MKQVNIVIFVMIIAIMTSCSNSENDADSDVSTADTEHKAALDAFNEAVEEYNQTVDDYCKCLEKEMDSYTCSQKHPLSFQATEEMEALSDGEYNLDHVTAGIEKIEAKEKELGL